MCVITLFDLFREEDNGNICWLGTVQDVEAGKKKARELMAFTPGRYFVFNQITGNKLYVQQENSSTKA